MTQLHVSELIIGGSQVARDLREAVCRAATLNVPVLIQGPTGAGKELVARGLHAESGRRGRFIPFNAAAISEPLFESELLGHIRGAFSGAVRDRAGLLRSARNGTVFMDEVAELPGSAQAKLLRVLDTREIWPVGADVADQVNFRLITATNTDLAKAVREKRFRQDLLFRVRGIFMTVPPLRDHPDDIIPLTLHFAKAIAAESGEAEIVFTPPAMRLLEKHAWPGNVRELRQAIEYAAFLAEGTAVSEKHVARALTWGDDSAPRQVSDERRNFLELLAVHAGDVKAVARVLGVDRSTVYRRMHQLGLTVGSRGSRGVPVSMGSDSDSVGGQ